MGQGYTKPLATTNIMTKLPTIDIILPCYNPIQNWEKTIISHFEEVKNNYDNCKFGLIIVNDGSTKTINEISVSKLKEQIPELQYISYEENKGKGYATRVGIKTSEADFQIYTDIDFPYENKSMFDIIDALLNDENDVVIGIRDESYYANIPKQRRLISKIVRLFNKRLLALPTDDTQCGLKGMNKNGREILLTTKINRYLFDIEFLKLAKRKKNITFKIQPVKLREGLIMTKIKMSLLTDELMTYLSLFFR